MRIKDINDLISVENNKVFYVTRLPDSIDDFDSMRNGNNLYPTVSDIRDKARIIPCKMVKSVNSKLGGYRMDNYERGYSFSCKESLSYDFVSLSHNEAKKYKVSDMFFGYNNVCYIPGNIMEYNGMTWYNKLTMYDDKEYGSYTEHNLCNREEFQEISDIDLSNENERVYFGYQIRVFTSFDEAMYYVERGVSDMVNDIVIKINKHSDNLKRDYYRFERGIEKGEIY